MPTSHTSQSADSIPVRHFRQLLLWPVLLELNRNGEGDEHTSLTSPWREWIKTLQRGGWQQRDCLPRPDTAPGITDFSCYEPTYEEAIYFHPYARDWLYGDGGTDLNGRAMLRFCREDVSGMKVTLAIDDLRHRWTNPSSHSPDEFNFLFHVARIEAYLCKPEVVILAVEVVWQPTADVEKLCLADVLILQSRIRELYPPFFVGDKRSIPGNCPRRVAWLGLAKSGEPTEIAVSDFDRGRKHFANQVAVGAEPPVAKHWLYLLEPIQPFLKRDEHGPCFRQIIDDRLPGLSYIAVDDPRVISDGDFDRLTFCETGGDTPYPYSAEFLDRSRGQYVYDRYWRESSDHDSPRDDGLKLNTRFLCSGFQFVAVGSWSNPYFAKEVQDHVRRHYFRLGLIAHFQRAALLKFADEMSEAIKTLKGQSVRQELDNETFRIRIVDLQMRFLKFVSRAWFSEVSNQLQGQELFRWWSGLLGSQRLFAEVSAMNQAMHSVMTEHDARKLSRWDVNMAIIAAVVAVISLVVAVATKG